VSHLNIHRGVGALFATGLIYAVNKRTGEITHLGTAEYARAEKCGLLDGFFVRLDPTAADALSAEIRAARLTEN